MNGRARCIQFCLVLLASVNTAFLAGAAAQPAELSLEEVLRDVDAAYAASTPYVVQSVTYHRADPDAVVEPRTIATTGKAFEYFVASVYPGEGVLLDRTHPKLREASKGRPVGAVCRGSILYELSPGARFALSRDLGPNGALALAAPRSPSNIPHAIRAAIAGDDGATVEADGDSRLRILAPKWKIEFLLDAHDFTLLRQRDSRGNLHTEVAYTEFQPSSIFKARFPRIVRTTFTDASDASTSMDDTCRIFDAPLADPMLDKRLVQWTTYADEARDEQTGITTLADGSTKVAPPAITPPTPARVKPSDQAIEALKADRDVLLLPEPDSRLRRTILAAGVACVVAGALWLLRGRLHGR